MNLKACLLGLCALLAIVPNTSAVHSVHVVDNTISYLRIDVTGDPGVAGLTSTEVTGVANSINNLDLIGRFLDLFVEDSGVLYPLGGFAFVQRYDVGAGFSVALTEVLRGGSVTLIPDGFSYRIGTPPTTGPISTAEGGATLPLLALGSAGLALFRQRK